MSWPAQSSGGGPVRPGQYTPHQQQPPHNTQEPTHTQQYPYYHAPQQQCWPPPAQPPQQFAAQPAYPAQNANHYYQHNQTQNNQTLNNQPPYQHNQTQSNQPPYQHNQTLNNQPPYQHNYAAPPPDGWEDNTWGDWGWEERNSQHQLQQRNTQIQPQDNLNANVLEESFGGNESWNWSAAPTADLAPPVPSFESSNAQPAPVLTDAPPPPVHSLGDRDAVRERRPDLALGKRVQLEKVTRQWSVESQMSQESSDGGSVPSADPSGRASPGPDPSLYNQISNSTLHDRHCNELIQSNNAQDGVVHAFQDLSINVENPFPDNVLRESNDLEATSEQDTATETAFAPPPLACPLLTSGQNPFKRAGPISHKNINKPVDLAATTSQHLIRSLSQNDSSTNRLSPSSISGGRAIQHTQMRNSSAYPTANLETPPENSERPDNPQPAYRPQPPPRVDNLESAPQHDRNEYLQTAHLSGDYSEYRRGAGAGEAEEPPPGLARMVPGQHTEPPPDSYLERHVDGQTDARGQLGRGDGRRTPDDVFSQGARGSEHRPVGMDRTVPGEFVQQFPTANDVRVVTGVYRDLDADGSDYTEVAGANAGERNTVGENLQDLSVVSSAELSFRDQRVDGAGTEVETRAAEASEPPSMSHHSAPPPPAHRIPTSGEETDRDRAFEASPRRERRRGSREGYRADEQDGERRRNEGRREDGRREERRRRRYDTEDTDYNSDREREYRRYRGSSYSSSKPPRPEDKERRHRDERGKHYATGERDRGYDERERRRFRNEPRGYSSLRRDRKRGDAYDRDPDPAEDELQETLGGERHDRRRRHERRDRDRNYDAYYDRYGGGVHEDPYQLQLQQQQQTYRYYEHLRLTDPAAYMLVYKKLMAGHPLPQPSPLLGYGSELQDRRSGRDERGSVHSGRSSANALSKDTDLNTDASLNLALEESTLRSDRMTPYKFCTAHVKGSISSHHLVLVRGSYPVDGLPATVAVLSLSAALQHDPQTVQLQQYPGPLVKGVTHKKSVMEYCEARVREATGASAGGDLSGYLLLWELLILLLRQNGVVVGTDVAELLLRNQREYPRPSAAVRAPPRPGSRHDSQVSSGRSEPPSPPGPVAASSPVSAPTPAHAVDAVPLDKYREYLLYGNHKDALEWAMSCGLWGHALQLAATLPERRARAAVSARFLAALPAADPLRTLYSVRAGRPPTAWGGEERCGDWRPHLAILLSNTSARADLDQRAIAALGDSLSARGLPHAAQFCHVMARGEFCPGASSQEPPRLTLLCGGGSEGAPHLAGTLSIAATEIYEYARSLCDDGFTLPELQVYKWVLACRLVDCGQYERALLYTEQIARAMLANPTLYGRALVRHVADMAERLKYADPALGVETELPVVGIEGDDGVEGESAPNSPARAASVWMHQLSALAQQQHQQVQYNNFVPEVGSYVPEVEQYDAVGTYSAYAVPTPPPVPAPVPTWHSPHVTPQHVPYLQQHELVAAETVGEAAHYPPPLQSHQQQHEAEPYHPPADLDYLTPADHVSDHVAWSAYAGSYAEEAGAAGEEARPHITMPGGGGRGAGRARGTLYDEPHRPADAHQERRRSDGGDDVQREDGGGTGGAPGAAGKPGASGWLDGLLSKISLKPKNQMILPDDKNPTIVWDTERKRWRNLDGDEAEPDGLPPPPTGAHLAAATARSAGALVGPSAALTANTFKMQRGRHIKKSYVDVFNPGGAPQNPQPAPASLLPPAPPTAAPTAYFVPSTQ